MDDQQTSGSAMTNEQEEGRDITLSDGVVVPVRVIQPGDDDALQRLHSRLSEQSIRLRFFGNMKELSNRKAKYFAHIDGTDRFALVALDPDEPDEIIAVVRFDREAGTNKAEYSALVEDHWQGCGVGVYLTQQLIEAARDREIQCLYGLVLPENEPMLKLLRSLDLPEHERRDGGTEYVEVELVA